MPIGGQTEFIKHLLDAQERGVDVFNKVNPQETPGQEKQPMKTIDYDKGLTPKERVERGNKRYDKNLSIYQEDQAKVQSLEHEADSLGAMSELSPQISGWERLNINPQTGSLIIPALASPEAQRFVKTVNDFTVNAKDSFGARVSNFELDRFMQRLPTLANSVEGRTMIIKQMQLINQMNLAKKKELLHVFDEHGGIRNIDYDAAERIADKNTMKEIGDIRSQFKRIESGVDSMYQKQIDKDKKIVPNDHVAVQRADGTTGYIPKKSLNKFLKMPGNKAL